MPGAFSVWLAATPAADFLQGRLIWSNWDVQELLEREEEIVRKDLFTLKLSGWEVLRREHREAEKDWEIGALEVVDPTMRVANSDRMLLPDASLPPSMQFIVEGIAVPPFHPRTMMS